MEQRGRPTVIVTTTKFESLTAQVAASFGLADARIAVVDHPLGGTSEEVITQWADTSVEAVLGLFTGSATRPSRAVSFAGREVAPQRARDA